MTVSEHVVNLDLPANQRWAFLSDYKTPLNNLLAYYLNYFERLFSKHVDILAEDYLAEIEAIASLSDFRHSDGQALLVCFQE